MRMAKMKRKERVTMSDEDIEKAAGEFWEKYERSAETLPHVCDVPIYRLIKRHEHVIGLLDKNPEWASALATLVAGDYYKDVWSSRSCSGYLAGIFGLDYLDIYCSSSTYYELKMNGKGAPIMVEYEKAKELDDREASDGK
jgi:hypothetical protein